jgi:hypothetical protein
VTSINFGSSLPFSFYLLDDVSAAKNWPLCISSPEMPSCFACGIVYFKYGYIRDSDGGRGEGNPGKLNFPIDGLD